MQLVLMNKVVRCKGTRYYDEHFYEVSYVHIYRDLVTWSNCKDEVAQQLISELLTSELENKEFSDSDSEYYQMERNSEFKMTLDWLKDKETTRTLHMKHANGDNILKSLRNKFYDKVKISVNCWDREEQDDPEQQASTGEMEISSDYECTGLLDFKRLKDLKIDYASSEFREFWTTMKITAHISLSDEEILSRLKVPFYKKVFETYLPTDVTILAKDGAQVEAHKGILAASSPVLQATFTGGFQESNTGELDMSDISEKGVRAFLRYVYYRDEEEPKKDPEVICELLNLAHKYDVSVLEAWALGYLMDKTDFTVELAFIIYSFVKNIEAAEALKSKVALILLSNLTKMEALPQYKEVFPQARKRNRASAKKFRNELRSHLSAKPQNQSSNVSPSPKPTRKRVKVSHR